MSILEELQEHVVRSRIDESLSLLDKAWDETRDHTSILGALQPASLYCFSHRFPNIHMPKEHEYLLCLLDQVSQEHRLDFLRRYVEYLAWSPKYANDATPSFTSGQKVSGDLEDHYSSTPQASIAMMP